jgi:toxin ParE1/3/4
MKTYGVIFTPRAEAQLDGLYQYIADHSGEARADHYVGGIISDCLSLATFPERGIKRDDVRPNLRIKNYAKRVMIAFSIDPTRNIVAIHGVFYGGQDFEPVLHETDSDE